MTLAGILPLSGVEQIGGGRGFSCALGQSGEVVCWGGNDEGQLGNGGTITPAPLPESVVGINLGIDAISVGHDHACALTESRTVLCWGRNTKGQLGTGGIGGFVTAPSPVQGLDETIQISAGGEHTCALSSLGAVSCWGDIDGLNLLSGRPDGGDSAVPVPVQLGGVAVQIAVGGDHACAVMASAEVKCWGTNAFGNGVTDFLDAPRVVPGIVGTVSTLALGDSHSCVLLDTGLLMCWGSNDQGQLGDGTLESTGTPIAVDGLGGPVDLVSAGGLHTCARSAGATYCWGWNLYGQLGAETPTNRSLVPVEVRGIREQPLGIVATSGGHSCALLPSHEVDCWGRNDSGQLGVGVVGSMAFNAPTRLSEPTLRFMRTSGGARHSCAITEDGGVWCWGENSSGELGNGGTINSAFPRAATGLGSGAVDITSGALHTCAVLESGDLRCWGSNDSGQLGTGGFGGISVAPSSINALAGSVVSASAGDRHTCAVTAAGALFCWGANDRGQLGNGSVLGAAIPTLVQGLAGSAAAVSAGHKHTCALLDSGLVQCWGFNDQGQLGNGTRTDSSLPVTVAGLGSEAFAVAASGRSLSGIAHSSSHSCALLQDEVKCWGDNTFGQLGEGTTDDALEPRPVTILAGRPIAIALGGLSDFGFNNRSAHSCALLDQGWVQCWGANGAGQLGSATFDDSGTPRFVQLLSEPVQHIASGSRHVCAVLGSGALRCWGRNQFRELGLGRTGNSVLAPQTAVRSAPDMDLTLEIDALESSGSIARRYLLKAINSGSTPAHLALRTPRTDGLESILWTTPGSCCTPTFGEGPLNTTTVLSAEGGGVEIELTAAVAADAEVISLSFSAFSAVDPSEKIAEVTSAEALPPRLIFRNGFERP